MGGVFSSASASSFLLPRKSLKTPRAACSCPQSWLSLASLTFPTLMSSHYHSFPCVPAPRLISAAPVLNQLISILALYLILLSSSTKQEAIFAPLLPPINSPELTRRATLFAPSNSLTEGTHAILRSLMEIIIWNQQVVKDKFVSKILYAVWSYITLWRSPQK